MKPVYLDYNATTPMDPRVFEAMLPYHLTEIGNAGSRTHIYRSERPSEAVDRAREQVAEILVTKPEEIIFTSGATESNNIALLGVDAPWRRHRSQAYPRQLPSNTRRSSSRSAGSASSASKSNCMPVTAGGYVEPDAVRERLRPTLFVVSVMHANNETGVLQPVVEIGELLADTRTLFHVDAAQTFGKEVEALRRLKCDFMSISGHKIYGPKGIGALYVRRSAIQRKLLTPLMVGGGQEMGLRPGTLPVPLDRRPRRSRRTGGRRNTGSEELKPRG